MCSRWFDLFHGFYVFVRCNNSRGVGGEWGIVLDGIVVLILVRAECRTD